MYCARCGELIDHPWPVEPLYDLDVVAMMIPVRKETLKTHLYTYREHYEEASYRQEGKTNRRVRVLSASEVRKLRAYFITTRKGKARSRAAYKG